VRKTVLEIDNNLPVYNISTMEQVVSNSIARTSLAVWLLGTFSVIGLLLAAVGVYGVIVYSVSQRTREIGVRMALGAQAGAIRKMIVRQGMTLALLGLGIGVAGAFALVPVMANLLWGVSARDLLTFIVTALLLITVSLIACYIPARRATKVDPIIALRSE
jgi:ABC-type antimicrobial peptide transport system permease subunit